MEQLTLFDFDSSSTAIKKIQGSSFEYEVGKGNVGKIEVTDHGSNELTIYKVSDACGELIIFAGMLSPHEVIFVEE